MFGTHLVLLLYRMYTESKKKVLTAICIPVLRSMQTAAVALPHAVGILLLLYRGLFNGCWYKQYDVAFAVRYTEVVDGFCSTPRKEAAVTKQQHYY